jgi:spore coat protein CotH
LKYGKKDFNDLTKLIVTLNKTNNFDNDIIKLVDLDRYLRLTAIEACNCINDNYNYGAHNYYLFKNPETNLFEFIPYDTTASFQKMAMKNSRFEDWHDATSLDWSFWNFNNNGK